MNDRFSLLIHRIRLCLVGTKRLVARGPHFKIVHQYRETGAGCLPGEVVAWVLLVFGSQEILLRIPCSLLLFFDYLARYHHFPQSAAQIVAGLRTRPFYVRHGANAKTGVNLTRRFSHRAIKVYVDRLRRALQVAFDEAGLKLEPFEILVSEPTEGNEVRYRLKATFEWIHV